MAVYGQPRANPRDLYDPLAPEPIQDPSAQVLQPPMPMEAPLEEGPGGGAPPAVATPLPGDVEQVPQELAPGVPVMGLPAPEQSKTIKKTSGIVESRRSRDLGGQLAENSEASAIEAGKVAAAKERHGQGAAAADVWAANQNQLDLQQKQEEQDAAHARKARADAQVATEVAAAEEAENQAFEATGKAPFEGNLGARILAALATGASSYNAHVLGKDPADMPAMRAIQGYIERDKQMKLARYGRSKEFTALKRQGYAAARQAFEDESNRIDATSANRLGMVLRQAEGLKANTKINPDLIQSVGEAAYLAEQQKGLEARLKQSQRYEAQYERTDQDIKGTLMGGRGSQARGPYPLHDIPGNLVGFTNRPTSKDDADKRRAAALDAQRLGNRLAEHFKTHGMEVLPGGAKGERVSLLNDLASQIILARSGKAATDAEREMLAEIILPSLSSQMLQSRGATAEQTQDFVGRELMRYADFVESVSQDPKQTRSLMRGGAESPQAAEYRRLIKAARDAGDSKTVEDLTREMQGL